MNPKNIALVDICDIGEKSKELQKEFPNQNIAFFEVDVSKRDSVDTAFKQVIEKFNRIDLLINSAGILKEMDAEATLLVNAVSIDRHESMCVKIMTWL